ncbi:chromosome partitioning protein ParB [Brucella sp. 10RB9214]|uniref:plasmid partitioning protein RepB C-terminal domain-containing protein n=1 Tax=unclassified Brucella TaxID=2632610 RepID=UPI0009727FD3|nr:MULTISPECIES: plasmid partitioning protein RepB C-terminal domain-containing protein [unclassified Brucella]APY15184.1 chromosome partitioning protein ParB [Brucella sp. 09RB8910]MRN45583.1 chromosome partitioning protein ParB [Brucella sp. 10RB9212]MRN50346.1 chromosome partitioning protein ParB [Brucella sp. 10RB9214]
MDMTPPDHHAGHAQEIVSVPIERIRILNPRVRSKKTFAGVVESIATVGLKRPITVAEASSDEQGPRYDLICGQGRIEAFMALGETHIPAMIVAAPETDRYLMSLVENLARRQHSSQDLLSAVQVLSDRGYTAVQIGQKTGLDPSYTQGILQLLRAGEERLITAVEKGWLPLSLAVEIARSSEADVQIAMMEAYEAGTLKGDQLLKVRRLIDKRKAFGQKYQKAIPRTDKPMTAARLAQTFQEEVRRQRLAIQKADVAEQRLLFVVSAMRKLHSEEHFRTLLRAEGIVDMPKPLADRLSGSQSA